MDTIVLEPDARGNHQRPRNTDNLRFHPASSTAATRRRTPMNPGPLPVTWTTHARSRTPRRDEAPAGRRHAPGGWPSPGRPGRCLRPGLRNRGGNHRRSACRLPHRGADLRGAGAGLPGPHRGVRPAGTAAQHHRQPEPRRARRGRPLRPGARRRRTHRAAALRPGPPQGPGRDPRHAHDLRIGALCGLRVLPGRHHRHPHEGRGRAHHRQDQHGRVRIALRGLGLRFHPQPVRPAAQPERLLRGDGRGRGREPGNDRHRRGHRRLHPRPVGGARAGRAQAHPATWSAATA